MSSPIEVNPSQIRKELEKLEKTHEQNNQLRASLFNLVVYAQKDHRLPFFQSLVDQIVEKFPCRVIFIEENGDPSDAYLKASISAKMLQHSENSNIVCDKIYLETSQNNTEQILHLLLEHTLVDLPVYLLWGKDPTKPHPLFPSLKHMAKRLIFHSECSENLKELSEKLLANILKDHWEVADLNWIHLQEWREVIKAIFNTQDALEDLSAIEEVKINFCKSSEPYFSNNHFLVHYLHGWLAAQLGWENLGYHDQENQKVISYAKEKDRITVTISEQSCGLKALPGTLRTVEIKTRSNKSFIFKTDDQEERIQVEIKDEKNPKNPYNTSIMKSQWQVYLSKEICYKETSEHYKNTLKVLSSIEGLV